MRTYLIIAFVSVCILSCSNDDDGGNSRSGTFDGKWNLVNVSGGLLGLDQDFEKGIIVWDFNTSNNRVTITNNSTLQDVYTGLPSGTYPYSITAPADADILIVNDINLGNININSSTFTVDQLAIDGLKMTFSR